MSKQITEDYCSFEIAKLLKEKGFKQDCDYATSWYAAEYYKNSAIGEWFEGEHQIIEDIDDKCTISYLSDKGIFIPAPTLQMALKWLREVHNWYIDIRFNRHYQYYIPIVYNMSGTLESIANLEERPKQYEQAVEAALLYVLKNLI
jgi:hypothetical protein